MSEDNRIEIPDSAKESLRLLYSQKQQAESNIALYLRALQDTLGITGQGWSLGVADMVFVQASPNGKADADVVEATASNSQRD